MVRLFGRAVLYVNGMLVVVLGSVPALAQAGSGTGSSAAPVPDSGAAEIQRAPPSRAPKPADCRIKGNINRAGEKIYHLPGGRWYDRTRISKPAGERMFCSEEEAVKAGWRRAK